MFQIPVELLALGKSFDWEFYDDWYDATYGCSGGWYKPSPPPPVMSALCKSQVIDPPRSLWHLVGKTASSTGFSSKVKTGGDPLPILELCRVIERHYWYTPDICQWLKLNRYNVSVDQPCPRPNYIRQADVESTLKDYSSSPAISDRQKKAYFSRLDHLKAMLSVFDAIALALQVVKRYRIGIPSRTVRIFARMKYRISVEPFSIACDLKDLANECRAFYFKGIRPKGVYSNLVKGFSRYEAFKFSYISRSLPAPMSQYLNEEHYVEDLATRLTSKPSPENVLWRPFVKNYIRDHKPKEVSYWTAPSKSAALGIPRGLGGHSRGYQYLIMYEMGHQLSQLGFDKFERKYMRQLPIGDVDQGFPDPLQRFRETCLRQEGLVGKSVQWSRVLNDFLINGALRQLRQIDQIPVVPLVCPEKGMKVRMPTCTLTSANLIMQPLRKVADSVLRADNRISESLGGKKPYPRLEPCAAGEDYVSVDASFATDGHDFWLTRGFYQELVEQTPELSWSKEFLQKLFGPRRLLLPSRMTKHQRSSMEHPQPMQVRKTFKPGVITSGGRPLNMYKFISQVTPCADWRKECEQEEVIPIALDDILAQLCGNRQERRKLNTPDPDEVWEGLMQFSSSVDLYLQNLNSLPSVVTTKGAMMGDPTSWPVLPLVTLFAVRRTRYASSARTCGDDALFKATKRDFDRFLCDYRSVCGQISINKTFLNNKKALFVEIPFSNGKEESIDLLSSWVGPSGGSKGELNWYNLPFSIRKNEMASGGFWKHTRFAVQWRAAQEAGIPIGASSLFGGLGIPGRKKTASGQTQLWLSYMSQIDLYQLLMKGGLSLVPPAGVRGGEYDKVLWEVIKPFIGYTPVEMELERPYWLSALESGPPELEGPCLYKGRLVKESLPRWRNPRSVLGIYMDQYVVPKHVPGVINTSERFRRRIRGRPVIQKQLEYNPTVADVESKTVRFLNLPPPAETKYRTFGISSTYAVAMREFPPWEQPFKYDDPDEDDPMNPLNLPTSSITWVKPE